MSASLKMATDFYFAFGSNMCLEQMASRCPDSILTAIGTLRGYRWQINQRGVANVVPASPSDIVVGIVFRVSERDVKTLDRNEGVSRGFYEKDSLNIELQPLLLGELSKQPTAIAMKVLRDHEESPRGVQTSNPRSMETANNYIQQRTSYNCMPSTDTSSVSNPKIKRALVYLSRRYCNDGSIRAEYVSRMALAVSDGKTLGISSSYLDLKLLPIIFCKPQDPMQPKKTSRTKSISKPDSKDQGRNVDGQRRKHGPSGTRKKRSRSVDGEEESKGRGRRKSQEDEQRDASQKTWLHWIGGGVRNFWM
jgi:hypothetical protein